MYAFTMVLLGILHLLLLLLYEILLL
jgi:hypothetical protein